MSGQVNDICRYDGTDYSIAAVSSPLDFNPMDFGFIPTPPHTGCRRGYICEYKVESGLLVLDNLLIRCENDTYPVFCGVSAQKPHFRAIGMMEYRGVNHRIGFSGSMILADEFLREYYIHMGFQRVWAYKKVIEVVIENDRVISTKDHSRYAAQLREKIDSTPDFGKMLSADIEHFVEESFSLDTKDKAWWI